MKSFIACLWVVAGIAACAMLHGCSSMPVQPVVDAKLNDLNRRVTFIYEMQRKRQITDERCEWFSGPEMKCAKSKEGNCSCVLADDGYGVAPVAPPEEEKPE